MTNSEGAGAGRVGGSRTFGGSRTVQMQPLLLALLLAAAMPRADAALAQRRGASAHAARHAAYLRDGHRRFGASVPKHTVHTYTQAADHFNFETDLSADYATFTQRYLLINEANWTTRGDRTAPIFVFTGAEGGNVQETAWAYTFLIDVACRMGSLVALFEHRYFGLSVPFGGNATEALLPQPNRVGLLSVEQALADYAALVTHVRDTHDAWDAPVITFGGSLAGTLAAFMRLRYPQLVDMSVASSAPVRGIQFSF